MEFEYILQRLSCRLSGNPRATTPSVCGGPSPCFSPLPPALTTVAAGLVPCKSLTTYHSIRHQIRITEEDPEEIEGFQRKKMNTENPTHDASLSWPSGRGHPFRPFQAESSSGRSADIYMPVCILCILLPSRPWPKAAAHRPHVGRSLTIPPP